MKAVKHCILTFIFLSTVTLAWGQQLRISTGDWEAKAEEAIKECFYMVRVEYVLEELASGRRFGRDGKTYFNRVFTTGLAAGGKLWMDGHAALSPWRDDGIYDADKLRVKYRPVVSKIELRQLGQDSYETIAADFTDTLQMQDQKMAALNLKEGQPSLEMMQGVSTKALMCYLIPGSDFQSNDQASLKLELAWMKVRQPAVGADDQSVVLAETSVSTSPELKSWAVLEVSSEPGRLQVGAYGLMLPSVKAVRWEILPFPRSVNLNLTEVPTDTAPQPAATPEQQELQPGEGQFVPAEESEIEKAEEEKDKGKKKGRIFKKDIQ